MEFAKEALAIFPCFMSPKKFDMVFPALLDEDQEDVPGTACPVQATREKLGQVSGHLFDLLMAIYVGGYDRSLKALAGQTGNNQAAIASKLLDDDETSDDLIKAVRDLLRKMEQCKGTVQVQAVSAPPPSLRTLTRISSNPTDHANEVAMQERARVWSEAQQIRKKVVSVATAKTKDGISRLVSKVFNNWKPVRKENHRAFFLAADLVVENAEKPWVQLSSYNKDELKNQLEFLESWPCGACDFIIMFDGRSRDARRVMDRSICKMTRAVEELWITYTGEGNLQRHERSRRVPFASSNSEAGYVLFPCARTKFSVKARNRFNNCGEDSTHFGSYSGVDVRPMDRLPRVRTPEEKAAILGTQTVLEANPPQGVTGIQKTNLPVFWQESKDVAFFAQILEDFDVKACVDLSPGTGALAQAAMMFEDSLYLGVCANESHCSWLQNVLDRAVLPHVIRTAGPLYRETLAAQIQEHYRDVLDSFNKPDIEEEEVDDREEDVSD